VTKIRTGWRLAGVIVGYRGAYRGRLDHVVGTTLLRLSIGVRRYHTFIIDLWFMAFFSRICPVMGVAAFARPARGFECVVLVCGVSIHDAACDIWRAYASASG
jgi:hypothetical protein